MSKKIVVIVVLVECILAVLLISFFGQEIYNAKNNVKTTEIYFTNEERQYKTGVERVGHVAIYLGDNYILHTASDYARIEKMSQKRWSYYIEARRFV